MPGGTDHSMRFISFTEIASLTVWNSDHHSLKFALNWERWALNKTCLPPVQDCALFPLIVTGSRCYSAASHNIFTFRK